MCSCPENATSTPCLISSGSRIRRNPRDQCDSARMCRADGEKAHFPLGIRFREAFVEPAQLRAIEIRRVEGEELHAGHDLGEEILGRREAVVTLAVHVEERVDDLARIVVVAKHGVELTPSSSKVRYGSSNFRR